MMIWGGTGLAVLPVQRSGVRRGLCLNERDEREEGKFAFRMFHKKRGEFLITVSLYFEIQQ